jgi:hypothetical protein
MFEHRSKSLISKQAFLRRLLKFSLFSIVLLLFSLGIGCIGYHYLASLSWVDSLLNASMILTGMGPVSVLNSNEAKLFASFYALFSGIAFLSTAAVIFAPIVHRFLHKLHLDDDSPNN